jgi:sugar phosphate isomerase/epimerase
MSGRFKAAGGFGATATLCHGQKELRHQNEENAVNTISFITANFVARELDYHMTEGWMQGDTATQAFYKPVETFEVRFGAMLAEIKALGFEAIDLWAAHLHPSWATEAHLTSAKALLAQHKLRVMSLAAGARDAESLQGFCHIAATLGATALAGGSPMLQTARAEAIAILKDYGVKLGIENHPEKTPAELLAQIGEGEGVIGAAPDTGWWATQGYSAPDALRELLDVTWTVHLKDVKAAGAHETCRLGDGVADIPGCVQVIREHGYTGPIGIEHEPESFDPREDVRVSKERLERWLKGGN